jgi:hypothetical protein
MARQTTLFGNVLPKQNRIYNIFSFKIGKDTYKKEINIKNSVSVLKMLQNLIIYLHARLSYLTCDPSFIKPFTDEADGI